MQVSKTKKPRKPYGMIQLQKETYDMLKAYCKENGIIMGHMVATIIRKELKSRTDVSNY
jgi:hypothetical protein